MIEKKTEKRGLRASQRQVTTANLWLRNNKTLTSLPTYYTMYIAES